MESAGAAPDAAAHSAFARNDYPLAVIHWTAARDAYASEGREHEVAHCDLQLGMANRELDQRPQAIAAYERARAHYVLDHADEAIDTCDVNIGIVHIDAQEHWKAIPLIEEARDRLRARGSEHAAALNDRHLGTCYARVGRPHDSIASYRAARAHFAEHNELAQVAHCDSAIGLALGLVADFQGAIDAYRAAIDYYRSVDALDDELRCINNLASVHFSMGRYDEGRKAILGVRVRSVEAGRDEQVARSDNNLGSFLAHAGEMEEAIPLLLSAKEWFAYAGMANDVAYCNTSLATCYLMLERLHEAVEALNENVRIYAEKKNDAGTAVTWRQLGSICLELRLFDKALKFKRAARQHFAARGLANEIAQCDYDIAVILERMAHAEADPQLAQGHFRDAFTSVLPAALFLDSVRFRLSSPAHRAAWRKGEGSSAIAMAFRFASSHTDTRLLRDLVSSMRSTGTLVFDASTLPLAHDPGAPLALPAPPALDDVDLARAASASAVRILGRDEVTLSPPPHIASEGGQVALREYLREAHRRYVPPGEPGLRSRSVIEVN